MSTTESAWLIERRDGPSAWLLAMDADWPLWTTESLDAVQFSRRGDAERMASCLLEDGTWIVTEHMWIEVRK